MAAATANQNLNEEPALAQHRHFKLASSTTVYRDSAAGLVTSSGNVGYANKLTNNRDFLGFFDEKVDNSSGISGAKTASIQQFGIKELAITSASISDIGKIVYASDDSTFTFTEGSNVAIGTMISRGDAVGKANVYFDARTRTQQRVTVLTDNTGGSASNTLAAAVLIDSSTGTATAGSIVAAASLGAQDDNNATFITIINRQTDAIASLTAKVNTLLKSK